MPELPEVETIARELREKIIGKSIERIEELRLNTVSDKDYSGLVNLGTVESVSRRGKYLIISTAPEKARIVRGKNGSDSDSGYCLLIHLRMTGKLIYQSHEAVGDKHTRAIISFTDRTKLLFNDVRTFGSISIIKSSDRPGALCKLGYEPFSPDFSAKSITPLLAKRKTTVKNFLLDQRFIAGLGNIYANEILYACKISPLKMTSELTKEEITSLVSQTKKILKNAIKHNGTSISDFRRVDDKSGSFQNFLKIYGKKSCKEGHSVTRIKTQGRSTFYCPQCQKEEEK